MYKEFSNGRIFGKLCVLSAALVMLCCRRSGWSRGGKRSGGNEKRLKNAGYADCGNNSWSLSSGGGGGGVVKIPIPGTMAPGFASWKPANWIDLRHTPTSRARNLSMTKKPDGTGGAFATPTAIVEKIACEKATKNDSRNKQRQSRWRLRGVD